MRAQAEQQAPLADAPSGVLALLSIIAFWLFYFLINTLRSFVLGHDDQMAMVGRRILVATTSMVITGGLYLALRGSRPANMRRSIIIAATLALPAAVAYGTVNWAMFSTIPMHGSMQHGMGTHGAGMPAQAPAAGQPGQAPAMPDNPAVGRVTSWEDQETPFTEIADNTVNGYFFFIAWASLYLALHYAAHAKALERRAAALRAAAQDAQLRALRYQVNPHFLFNTLNSLSSLVLSDKRETAERMIANLAVFFRTSLQGDPTKDVSLAEEIALQRLYLDIERVRFPERLGFKIDLPPDLEDLRVPGLILQPVVENAVKHGVSRTIRPVTIDIGARLVGERLLLSVEDDGDGDGAPHVVDGARAGVGLRNVRDRLEARFGDAAECAWGPCPGGGFAVSLAMPAVRDDG
jgi:two-component system, LytTR family, sensor kinase